MFAVELHNLLHAAGLQPPYILVAHSIAGFTIRLYAARYRPDVAGIVLVDSSHPDQFKRLPPDPPGPDAKWIQEAEFAELTAHAGIPRCSAIAVIPPPSVPPNARSIVPRKCDQRRTFREGATQAGGAGDPGDLPLLALSHRLSHHPPDIPAELEVDPNRVFEEMQQELTELSTRGRRIIAENSGYYVQRDRPDVMIKAVHEVVAELRQHQ